MALDSKITGTLSATQTLTLDLGKPSVKLEVGINHSFADGGGAGQANLMFSDRRTLASEGSEDLDLAGSLTDAFGATVTFTKLKAILVKAATANTTNLAIGGAASNAFINWVGDATDTIVVKPGGSFLLVDPSAGGYAVTAGTGDLLAVTNGSGASATYDIVLLGA